MQKRLAAFSPDLCSLIRRPTLIRTLLLSSFASSCSTPDFLPSYLVTKCGLSPDKAAKASEYLSRRVRTPDQPDSVIAFLKSHGFNDSQLNKLVSTYPPALALRVEETLAPKFRAFRELGFTGDDLTAILCSCPLILSRSVEHHIVPMINLLKRLFGSHDLLMKCLTSTLWRVQIINSSLERTLCNISLLHDLGLSDHQIGVIVRMNPFIIMQKPDMLNKLVCRGENLGIQRGSSNFHWVVYALSKVSDDNLEPKVKLFRRFGWSEDDFAKAFRKAPVFFTSSLKMLEEKMEFFVKEAGCTASYIAHNPVLLSLSLEKRLIPRLKVLKALKEKGLSGGDHKLGKPMTFTNNMFFERYVARHKDAIPELSQLFSGSS